MYLSVVRCMQLAACISLPLIPIPAANSQITPVASQTVASTIPATVSPLESHFKNPADIPSPPSNTFLTGNFLHRIGTFYYMDWKGIVEDLGRLDRKGSSLNNMDRLHHSIANVARVQRATFVFESPTV